MSAISANTSSSSGSMASGSMAAGSIPSTMATVNFGALISIKLTRDNFLLWKTQVVPILRSVNLLGYVDGSKEIPPQFVPKTAGTEVIQEPNPAYLQWLQQDQTVMGGLLTSLSPEVLGQVTLLTNAREVWTALEQMYESHSYSKVVQVRTQLATLQKKDLSAAAYFQKVKTLADSLAAVGKPMSNEDFVSYLLAGLDGDYDPLVASLMTRSEALTPNEVYAHFLSFDSRLESRHTSYQRDGGFSANFSARGGTGGRGRGGGGGNRGGRGRPQGRGGSKPVCQICSKVGHTAIKCWSRFDHAFQEDQHVAAFANNSNNYVVDTNWYSDTGATDHITSDLDRLSVREKYQGKEQVHTANGSGSGNEGTTSARQM